MNILYWNIKNNSNVIPLLPKLCIDKKIDILILSEIKDMHTIDYITRKLKETGDTYICELPLPGNRSFLFHRLGKKIIKIKDGKYYATYKLSYDDSEPILLVALHLPSKMYREDNEIGYAGSTVKRDLEILEEKNSTNKSIVVGDFNMNPFTDGMVSAYGFHAIMCKSTALKLGRKVDGDFCKYFYNPMWSLHGNDNSTILGSYYYHQRPTSFVWNMFDQVIIRPVLIKNFIAQELEIIHEINNVSILTAQGIPNKKDYSDHLPLKFRITMEG